MRQGITLLMLAAFALTGCETMDSTMTSMKTGVQDMGNRIAAIDFSMPYFGGDDADDSTEMNYDESAEGQALVLASGDTTCPPVSVVSELGEIHQFSNPDMQINDTLISNAKIARVTTDCTVNNNNVALEINMTFTGTIGPDAKVMSTDSPSFSYPYFVALTTNSGNIIAKEVFAANMSYKGEQTEAMTTESMRQIIPLNANGMTAADEILIGFQLSDDELAYNQATIQPDPFDALGIAPDASYDGNPADIQPATGEPDELSRPISIFGE